MVKVPLKVVAEVGEKVTMTVQLLPDVAMPVLPVQLSVVLAKPAPATVALETVKPAPELVRV